jgi:hypothetical protein
MEIDQDARFAPFESGRRDLPPRFCQYAAGPCDQDFTGTSHSDAFFLYPSEPRQIAATIEACVKKLKYHQREKKWRSWRDLGVPGRLVFCEICKACRFADAAIADVTTLNFNVLFEIGFALGLGLPVVLLRDSSYLTSKKEFDELGILDTVGYQEFANSEALAHALPRLLPAQPISLPTPQPFLDTPLYFLKGPIVTDGAVKLMSTLKKSALQFRTHDPVETPRLSFFEACRQVNGSLGVVAHLLSPARRGATAHNGLCAFLCGLAMAQSKVVIMLQEEFVTQPIDYRDVVQPFVQPDRIPQLLQRPIKQVVQHLRRPGDTTLRAAEALLDRLDLGDPIAENEITGLRSYFVPTGAFTQAKLGSSRLAIGRKGTGKTALFHALRDAIGRGHDALVVDLKPEGYQFTKLKEAVLESLTEGPREHTLTAFWNYILLAEIAHTIVFDEVSYAHRDPDRLRRWEKVSDLYEALGFSPDDDLSQRLLEEVDRLATRFGAKHPLPRDARITELVYGGDIRPLQAVVSDYLREKKHVWVLIDNLDKGWPTRGADRIDILIVRSLLEAARKLQQSMQVRNLEFHCLLFLRTDIYEHLVAETPDKGKDAPIRLDWDDREVLQEVVRRRVEASAGLVGPFRTIQHQLFEPLIGAEDTFNYVVDRTLMRPRDLIQFLQRAKEVAMNRGHELITASDILQAESSYSGDLLNATQYEIADTRPEFRELLDAFFESSLTLSHSELCQKLLCAGVDESAITEAIELLVWFGVLGVCRGDPSDAKYAYDVAYNLRRLLHNVKDGRDVFVIHPGFRSALGISS